MSLCLTPSNPRCLSHSARVAPVDACFVWGVSASRPEEVSRPDFPEILAPRALARVGPARGL
eukprot:2349785-Prymnesium_polylepis.1